MIDKLNKIDSLPLVSVCIVTYNHKDYISQCLDSVLMQQTNFLFEIILGEDESFDGTRQLCIQYANNYPDKIKLFLRSRKDVIYIQGKPTGRYNLIQGLRAASGKYVAMLEGDDYWTDPHKLQKQVDFLEANEDYAICYHEVSELENGELHLSKLKPDEKEGTYTIEDLAENNFIHTASVLFRNGLIPAFPSWFSQSPAGDYPLYMLNARHGKIKYFAQPMSIYRRHNEGVWGGKTRLFQITNLLKVIECLLVEFEEDLKVCNKLRIQKNIYTEEILKEYLKQGEIELFKMQFSNSVNTENQILVKWLEEQFFLMYKEKEKIDHRLESILNSNTYRFLKKIRIFK